MSTIINTTTTQSVNNNNYVKVVESVTEIANNFLDLPSTVSLLASSYNKNIQSINGSNQNDKLFPTSYEEYYSTSVYDFGSETTYSYGGNTSTNSR